MKYFLIIGAILFPLAANAARLEFPSNALLSAEVVSPNSSYAIPIGAFENGAIPSKVSEGEVTQQAWRYPVAGITSLQVIGPLRDQLIADGFAPLFECETQTCGGFDFRFNTDVLPAPDMFVNLGDFRFFSAEKSVDGTFERISVLASVSSTNGFVQVTRVGTPNGANAIATSTKNPIRATRNFNSDFGKELDEFGRVVLSDLTFETGSSSLGKGDFTSLTQLADYLSANPDRTVALVGHTDSEGSLSGNISLSKRRASSVLERLITEFNVPRRQLEAEGMGYLSPLATNLTSEGRELNRRVEVIVTSTK